MASQLRNFIKYYMPGFTIWYIYNNYKLVINKQPSLNIRVLREAEAPLILSQLLTQRAYLMDLELEVRIIWEKPISYRYNYYPWYLSVSRTFARLNAVIT